MGSVLYGHYESALVSLPQAQGCGMTAPRTIAIYYPIHVLRSHYINQVFLSLAAPGAVDRMNEDAIK